AAALGIGHFHALFAGHLAIAAQLVAFIASGHAGNTATMRLFGPALAHLLLVLEFLGDDDVGFAGRLLLQSAVDVFNFQGRIAAAIEQLGWNLGEFLGTARRRFFRGRRRGFLL